MLAKSFQSQINKYYAFLTYLNHIQMSFLRNSLIDNQPADQTSVITLWMKITQITLYNKHKTNKHL